MPGATSKDTGTRSRKNSPFTREGGLVNKHHNMEAQGHPWRYARNKAGNREPLVI